MKAKRHEALAAALLSGTVIFASASFAAGAADLAPPAPGSAISDSPSIPGPADASKSDGLPPAADVAAPPAEVPPAAESSTAPAAAPPAGEQAAAGPVGEQSPAAFGKRSVDTSHMSRRQAERTEKKITQELNRAAAQGLVQADAGQPSNSRNQIGRP